MILAEFLLSAFVALMLSMVFFVGFARANWKAGLAFYFLILFLATWAGGIWIVPVGPSFNGLFWMPFVAAGLLFALLLTAVLSKTTRQGQIDAHAGPAPKPGVMAATDAFFRLLVIGLAIVIAAGYLR